MKNNNVKDLLMRYSLLLLLFVLIIIFSSLQDRFLTVSNFVNILRSSSLMGVMAVGLTMVVVSGEIDLSFGAIASLSAVTSLLLIKAGMSVFIVWPFAVLLGVLAGVLNAYIVVRLNIPSLLGTIGTWLGIRGLTSLIADGSTIWIANYPDVFNMIGRNQLFGIIPAPIVTLIIVAFAGVILLEYTVLGRYFYAVGGNPDAATHAGISTKRMKSIAYITLGFLSGVAGISMASLYASSTPTVGQQFFFPAIIATFLGSVFIKNGVPNIWGTVVAALFLSVLSNGFNLIGLMHWHEDIAQGLLMLLAVVLITQVGKKKISISM